MEQETYLEYKDPTDIINGIYFLDNDQKTKISNIYNEQLVSQDAGNFRICTDAECQLLISTYQYCLTTEDSLEEQKLLAGLILHSFQPMILNILNSYFNSQDISSYTREDMLQEANIKVFNCLSNYKSEKGVRLDTYVYTNALAGLKRGYNNSHEKMFRIPELTLYKLRNIRKDIDNGMNVEEALDKHTKKASRKYLQFLLNTKQLRLDSNNGEDDDDRHCMIDNPQETSIEDIVELSTFIKDIARICKPGQLNLIAMIMCGYKISEIAETRNVTASAIKENIKTLRNNIRKKIPT